MNPIQALMHLLGSAAQNVEHGAQRFGGEVAQGAGQAVNGGRSVLDVLGHMANPLQTLGNDMRQSTMPQQQGHPQLPVDTPMAHPLLPTNAQQMQPMPYNPEVPAASQDTINQNMQNAAAGGLMQNARPMLQQQQMQPMQQLPQANIQPIATSSTITR